MSLTKHHPFRGPTYATGFLLAMLVVALVLAPALSRLQSDLRPLTSPLSADDLSCQGGEYQTTHLLVLAGGCQAVFTVMYGQNLSHWSATGQYNFSFAIPWIVEITPSGELVRLASPLDPYAGTANVTVGPKEVNLSSVESMNVTSASGNWTPDDTWAGSGPQWSISSQALGTTTVDVVFHLSNVTANASANATENASYEVKFDVGVSGWPWASSDDLLGFGLESLGAEGAHFAFNSSSRTLDESWNSTGRTFASLVFGGLANVTYPAPPVGHASVGEQVGLFYAASPARESVALVTFGGVAGNYSSVSYDPWVVFSPTPPLSPSSSSSSGWPTWIEISVWLVAGVVGVSLVVSILTRGRRLRLEGEKLVEGMRRVISEGADTPHRPR